MGYSGQISRNSVSNSAWMSALAGITLPAAFHKRPRTMPTHGAFFFLKPMDTPCSTARIAAFQPPAAA
jgi:hypothetical protein